MYAISRGLLLWAANTTATPTRQRISLDETNNFGIPFTQRLNLQPDTANFQLQPKRVIKSQVSKSYYVLAYVLKSNNLVGSLQVRSTPYVLKLDDNLNLIWSSKIQFNTVTNANNDAIIAYNNVFELNDQNIMLVGRFSFPFYGTVFHYCGFGFQLRVTREPGLYIVQVQSGALRCTYRSIKA